MPYLTGDSLSGETCRTIAIPGDLAFLMAVNGALTELQYEHNWEQFGTVTPAAAADAMRQMLFDFLDSECVMPFQVSYQVLWPPDFAYIGASSQVWISNTTQKFGGYWHIVAPAVNDTLTFSVYLPGAKYRFTVDTLKTTNSGQVRLSINGVSQITQDLYNATNLFNQSFPTGDVSCPEGNTAIELKVTGKNGASTGFDFLFTRLIISRRGDL